MEIPEHVAIILDGNGRWAKKRMLPRNMGHAQGSKNVEKMCRVSHKLGIKYLTVYAFSTENWKRPKAEIDALMVLLGTYLNETKEVVIKKIIKKTEAMFFKFESSKELKLRFENLLFFVNLDKILSFNNEAISESEYSF